MPAFTKLLFQKRQHSKITTHPLHLEKSMILECKNIFKICAKQWRYFFLFAGILSVLEVSIAFLIHFFFLSSVTTLDWQNIFVFTSISLASLVLYLIIAYQSIHFEKEIIFLSMNAIKQKWFDTFLQSLDKSNESLVFRTLINKFTLHINVLQAGLSHGVFPLLYTMLSFFMLTISSISISPWALAMVLLSIILGCIILVLNYHISKKILAQEQTAISLVYEHITETHREKDSIALLQRQHYESKKMKSMLDIDAHFRIRREKMMKIIPVILFVFITAMPLLLHLLIFEGFDMLELTWSENILFGIIIALCLRQLYRISHAGLHLYSLKMGIILSLNQYLKHLAAPIQTKNWNQIRFHGNHITLGSHYKRIKTFDLTINKGKTLLITGALQSGKTLLAHILAAKAPSNLRNAWHIIIDNTRFSYQKWKQNFHDVFFVHPNFYTEKTWFEIFCLDQKEGRELQNIYTLLKEHPGFRFILTAQRDIGAHINMKKLRFVEQGLLQLALVLIHQPSLCVIDNVWLDLPGDEYSEALRFVQSKCPSTSFVIFSQNIIPTLHYEETFDLSDLQVSK